MNFRDAAIKILADQKRSLHYKQITKMALKQNLIEHMGNNPEKRMFEMLKLEVKKTKSTIEMLKSGFFILKKFLKKQPKRKLVLSDTERKLYEINNKQKGGTQVSSEELQNVSEYSKQIYKSRYFSNKEKENHQEVIPNTPPETLKTESKEKKGREKGKGTSSKEQTKGKEYRFTQLEPLLNYFVTYFKRKPLRYYDGDELLKIVKQNALFNPEHLKGNELINQMKCYQPEKKNNPFFYKNQKIALIESVESGDYQALGEALLKIQKDWQFLLKRDLQKWLLKLSVEQFKHFLSNFLESCSFQYLKPQKGSSGYFQLSKAIGLSKLSFILWAKRQNTVVLKQDIIEFRGMLPRFHHSNGILLTTAYFDDTAIEEAACTPGTNIILMDLNFIIDQLKKSGFGLLRHPSGAYRVDHHYFLTL